MVVDAFFDQLMADDPLLQEEYERQAPYFRKVRLQMSALEDAQRAEAEARDKLETFVQDMCTLPDMVMNDVETHAEAVRRTERLRAEALLKDLASKLKLPSSQALVRAALAAYRESQP